ncbi:hypothetical protein SEA_CHARGERPOWER_38 [Mycobacterium phage Chargerpower]|nr:hypothetical protein SEA_CHARGERPOWER_38 [Mycobacterium phage Chargerpower]
MTLNDLILTLNVLRNKHGGDIKVKLYVPDRDYGDSEGSIEQIWGSQPQ